MSFDGGTLAWAALMSALALAYLVNLARDPAHNGVRLLKAALAWVTIISVCWLAVRWLTGTT